MSDAQKDDPSKQLAEEIVTSVSTGVLETLAGVFDNLAQLQPHTLFTPSEVAAILRDAAGVKA